MKIGIVGLPNVGKSTLFNAFLKRQQALSANYPFATIEPNIGIVDVIDKNVDKLAKLSSSEKLVYANITFVDIAGIVEGAHKGEGLGNKFLANIREVDLILVLLRDFDDSSIVKEHSINPDSDFETIKTELVLKDLESLESRSSKIKRGKLSKEELIFKNALEKVKKVLEDNKLAIETKLIDAEEEIVRTWNLLTFKPLLKVLNVSEDDERLKKKDVLCVSAKIESELAVLNEDDQELFLQEYGLKESPLNRVIRECYAQLGYLSFYTTGIKESRAWKFKNGMNAVECAGIIHTDFEKHFIKAEVISLDDFLQYKSKVTAKEAGKLRLEGKDYLMKDKDIVEFKVGSG